MNTLNFVRTIYVLADVMLLFLTVKAFLKRTKMGNVVGMAIAAGFAVVTFYTLSLFASSYFYMSLYNSCVFFSIDILLFLLVRYITIFCQTEIKGDSIVARVLFAGLIMMDGIVLMLNPFKEIAVSYSGYEMNGFMLYTYVAKPYFYWHLTFCYFFVIIGVIMLVYKTRITPKMYRSRYSRTLLGFIFVVLLNFLFLAGMELFSIDFSIIFYAAIALMIYTATFSFNDRFLMSNRNTVFQSIGLPILLFDYEQKLNDYNDQAKMLFPFINDETTCLPDFLENSLIILRSLYDNDSFVYRIKNDSVEEIYRGEYVCYKEDNGKLAASMFVFHNITQEQTMLEEEQSMNRAKSNFLVNVSYGVKKPLYTITSGVEKLRENHENREMIIQSVQDAVNLTLNVVDELMDYAMLETEHYEVRKEIVPVSEYVEFLQRVILTCEQPDKIKLEVDDFLPGQLLSNNQRLQQISNTLIRNAVDNAEGNEVDVLLYYAEESKDKGTLNLEITHYGPDVWTQAMGNIERFLRMPEEQVDSIAIKDSLELYMTCRLAQQLGGDVRISTDKNTNSIHAFVRVELVDDEKSGKMNK